jgi:peptide-methionine (S)-S-oxide reductase
MNDQMSQMPAENHIETATLGGGCFWCLEPVFEELTGVQNVVVGYSGGMTPKPDYQQVCTGMTGHAEVIQVKFDTRMISYEDILRIFFSIHDPTTLNRQGADVGTQYRSIILYENEQQKAAAERVLCEMEDQDLWSNPLVTEIVPLQSFYEAEAYHQGYFKKNPYQGYCTVVIAPKVAKFRKQFRERLKTAESKP